MSGLLPLFTDISFSDDVNRIFKIFKGIFPSHSVCLETYFLSRKWGILSQVFVIAYIVT